MPAVNHALRDILLAYNLTFKLRTVYYTSILTIILISLAFGTLLEAFMLAYVGGSITLLSCMVMFVICPSLFKFAAVCADRLVLVIRDAVYRPPMAFMTSALLRYGVPRLFIDIFYFLGIEGFPMVAGIWRSLSGNKTRIFGFIDGYILGGICWAGILGILMTALTTHLYFAPPAETRHATHVDLVVGTSMVAYLPKCNRFFDWYASLMLNNMIDYDRLDEFDDLSKNQAEVPWSSPVPIRTYGRSRRNGFANAARGWLEVQLGLMVVALVAYILAELGVWDNSSRVAFSVALIVVSVIMLLARLRIARQFPSFLGGTITMMQVMFLVLALSIGYSNIIGFDSYKTSEAVPVLVPSIHGSSFMIRSLTNSKYPICDMSWGFKNPKLNAHTHAKRLTVLDLALFSYAAYGRDEEVEDVIRNATKGTDISRFIIESDTSDQMIGSWLVVKLPESRIRLLVVRGTQTGGDIVADAYAYATVFILQLANRVVPVLEVLPTSFVREIVDTTFLRRSLHRPESNWGLIRATQRWKQKSDEEGFQFLVTGHSLGGISAAWMGASVGAPAVAFSPPGEYYSLQRMGIKDQDVRTSLIAVQPALDAVPLVDVQSGFTQHIHCSAGVDKCHSILRTMCELYRVCGDPRGRQWAAHENHPDRMCESL
eukprot:TRINITY_DN46467_c0_g1_i1.p1 TRINITY_DN46467_c0_g1~~TRINITY_DN46467_c0_g1_i1.p1  ORF type:complete len:656 (+),score=57.18 TRINITY_DN46467_c0_g1_i1:54-2021(+)